MLSEIWQRLRLPLSLYLMPVYLFALSISPNFTGDRLLWSFLLIHFFLLPSSHRLTSRIENHNHSLSVVIISAMIGITALVIGFSKVSLLFSLLMLAHLLISFFASFTHLKVSMNVMLCLLLFIIAYIGINDFSLYQALQSSVITPALLLTFLLMAPFPVIQQTEPSGKQMKPVIQLTGILTTVSVAAMGLYFYLQFTWNTVVLFLLSVSPMLIFLSGWWIFSHRMNTPFNIFRRLLFIITSVTLNGFFIWLFIRSTHIDQLFQ